MSKTCKEILSGTDFPMKEAPESFSPKIHPRRVKDLEDCQYFTRKKSQYRLVVSDDGSLYSNHLRNRFVETPYAIKLLDDQSWVDYLADTGTGDATCKAPHPDNPNILEDKALGACRDPKTGDVFLIQDDPVLLNYYNPRTHTQGFQELFITLKTDEIVKLGNKIENKDLFYISKTDHTKGFQRKLFVHALGEGSVDRLKALAQWVRTSNEFPKERASQIADAIDRLYSTQSHQRWSLALQVGGIALGMGGVGVAVWQGLKMMGVMGGQGGPSIDEILLDVTEAAKQSDFSKAILAAGSKTLETYKEMIRVTQPSLQMGETEIKNNRRHIFVMSPPELGENEGAGVGKSTVIEKMLHDVATGELDPLLKDLKVTIEHFKGYKIFIVDLEALAAASAEVVGRLEKTVKALDNAIKKVGGKALVYFKEAHLVATLGVASVGTDSDGKKKTTAGFKESLKTRLNAEKGYEYYKEAIFIFDSNVPDLQKDAAIGSRVNSVHKHPADFAEIKVIVEKSILSKMPERFKIAEGLLREIYDSSSLFEMAGQPRRTLRACEFFLAWFNEQGFTESVGRNHYIQFLSGKLNRSTQQITHLLDQMAFLREKGVAGADIYRWAQTEGLNVQSDKPGEKRMSPEDINRLLHPEQNHNATNPAQEAWNQAERLIIKNIGQEEWNKWSVEERKTAVQSILEYQEYQKKGGKGSFQDFLDQNFSESPKSEIAARGDNNRKGPPSEPPAEGGSRPSGSGSGTSGSSEGTPSDNSARVAEIGSAKPSGTQRVAAALEGIGHTVKGTAPLIAPEVLEHTGLIKKQHRPFADLGILSLFLVADKLAVPNMALMMPSFETSKHLAQEGLDRAGIKKGTLTNKIAGVVAGVVGTEGVIRATGGHEVWRNAAVAAQNGVVSRLGTLGNTVEGWAATQWQSARLGLNMYWSRGADAMSSAGTALRTAGTRVGAMAGSAIASARQALPSARSAIQSVGTGFQGIGRDLSRSHPAARLAGFGLAVAGAGILFLSSREADASTGQNRRPVNGKYSADDFADVLVDSLPGGDWGFGTKEARMIAQKLAQEGHITMGPRDPAVVKKIVLEAMEERRQKIMKEFPDSNLSFWKGDVENITKKVGELLTKQG